MSANTLKIIFDPCGFVLVCAKMTRKPSLEVAPITLAQRTWQPLKEEYERRRMVRVSDGNCRWSGRVPFFL